MRFSNDGKYLFSASYDGSVRIFDMPTFEKVNVIDDLHEGTLNAAEPLLIDTSLGQILSIAITPDASVLATASQTGDVKLTLTKSFFE